MIMPNTVNNLVLLLIVRISRTNGQGRNPEDIIFRNTYLGTCYIAEVTFKHKKLMLLTRLHSEEPHPIVPLSTSRPM